MICIALHGIWHLTCMQRWPEMLGQIRVRLQYPDTLFAYTFILLSCFSGLSPRSVHVGACMALEYHTPFGEGA